MRFLNRSWAGMCLLTGMVSGLSYGALPEALQQAPADSQVVIVSQPLAQISAKTDLFARQAQLPLPGNAALNLGQMIDGELGLGGQLDSTRGLVVCIGDLSESPEESLVVFLPVKDAQAAIKASGAEASPDAKGVWEMSAKNVCFMPAGKVLLMGPHAEWLTAVAQKPKGVKLSPADQALFEQCDVAAIIRLEVVLAKARQEMLDGLAGDEDIKAHPAVAAIATMGIERLGELQHVAIGGRFVKEGVALTARVQARAETTLAKYLTNHPGTTAAAFGKLPNADYLFAQVLRCDPRLIIGPMNAIVDALVKDTTLSNKMDAAEVNELKTILQRMYGKTLGDGAAEAMYVPASSGGGPGAMRFVEVTAQKDVAAVMGEVPRMCALVSKAIERAGFALPITYAVKAGTTDGLSYDELTLDLSQLPLPAEAMQALAMQWGGQAKFSEQICLVGAERVAVGAGPGCLGQAVKLAKGGGGLDKDPNMARVARNLPGEANVLAAVNVGNYFRWALSPMMGGGPQANPMMMMMGMMFGQVRGTMGFAAVLKEGAVQVDVFVPTDLVESVAGAVMQMQAGMMQPGTGPGAGGPRGRQSPPPGPSTF